MMLELLELLSVAWLLEDSLSEQPFAATACIVVEVRFVAAIGL